MSKNKKIILYSMPECPPCNALKAFLKENKIKFENLDVEFNLENRERLKELSGSTKVPYIIIDGVPTLGFQEETISNLLGIK
ncbi:MAG: glutaredoxin domain-containing protein [Candidatus Paceibacterota bacterium]